MSYSNENDFLKTLERFEFDIISGFFRPRERLIEKDLGERYHASRGTIRKVLLELEFRHLIKHFSNRGARVAEPSKKEMQDIYNARVMIESYAIGLAIQNSSNLNLDQIIIYQKAFEEAVADENLKDIIASNGLFHQEIFQACGNRVVVEMIDQLRKRSHIWQHYIVGHAARMQATIQEHGDIVSCLKKGNGAELKNVNKNHLAQGFKSYCEDLMMDQT
jgi:DNA-binding GntR family transcriptional regulator